MGLNWVDLDGIGRVDGLACRGLLRPGTMMMMLLLLLLTYCML